eukprot:gene7588-9089_t
MASIRIIITSAFKNTDRRHASRATWLKWVKHFQHSISYSFFIDTPSSGVERFKIEEEATYFKDIVQLNTTPPQNFNAACNFRRWEALAHEYSQFQNKVDFYIVADDDSFVCIHHLLSDSKYWPVSQRVHIAHFFRGGPDVISIYSSLLVKDALQLVSTNAALKHRTLYGMSNKIKDVDNINELRFAYGAKGYNESRRNDLINGWIGGDLLNATEKRGLCNSFLSVHQAYPLIMIDLWNYITTRPVPAVFTVPVLSRDIVSLDSTKGGYE